MAGQRTCPRPSLEEHFTAYMRTKHAAQHIEHSSRPNDMEEPAKKDGGSTSHPSPDSKPVDSAIGTPQAPSSTTSRTSQETTQAGARPSTSSLFKPPTPLRNYREEPKVWVDYDHEGGKAGKAIAEWKENMVPLIHDVTKNMCPKDRTEFFDKLIDEDQDRYLQPLGTYYTFYPDHIPERELSEKQAKKIAEGMLPLPPRAQAAQERMFRRFFNGDWSWSPDQPSVTLQPDLGPRDESSPETFSELSTCQHCINQTRKGKALRIVKPVMVPVRAIRRTFSKSVRTESQSSATTEVSRDISDDDERPSSGSGSKDSKPRDVTETGVGMRRPMSVPRRGRRRGKEVNEVL